MPTLKEIAKKVPVLPSIWRSLRSGYARYQVRSKTTEQIYTEICRSNAWGGKDSVSGPGSDVDQTRVITKELPVLFRDLNISTMLDIPCGDFCWMRNVDLTNMDYTGADIVKDLIQKNSEKYGRGGVRFQHLNLIEDKLPTVDLILCRDCLVHLSFEDIFSALQNVCDSRSEYFLTTTFTCKKDNHQIVTGRWWRALNLELAPFMLPKPLKIINEGCTEGGCAEYKALGLWRTADIRESLANRRA